METTGYDIKIFLSMPSNELLCFLCQKILRDPVQCKVGHMFCRSCITEHLSKKKTCPIDLGRLKSSDFSLCLIAKYQIDQLNIWCPSNLLTGREAGCDWKGTIKGLEEHLLHTCQNQPFPSTNNDALRYNDNLRPEDFSFSSTSVTCENAGCNKIVDYFEQSQHKLMCQYRLIDCPNQCSSTSFPFYQVLDHFQTCPNHLVPCPLKAIESCVDCLGTVRRADLGSHVTKSSESIIKCCEKLQRFQEELSQLRNSSCELPSNIIVDKETKSARKGFKRQKQN
jgi:hypothetical protein